MGVFDVHFRETEAPAAMDGPGKLFKRLPGKGSELPGALPRRRPQCALTVRKRTLGAHFGLVSSHCLGLKTPFRTRT